MKRMIDSFIKNIVRQSLNESYGLLNEYDITTTRKVGDIPIGSIIKNMTLPQCPDGGFCYGNLEQAKKDYEELPVRHWNGLIQKYCPSKKGLIKNRGGKGIPMGKPTMNTSTIQSVSAGLWEQLTDTFMDSDIIKNGLQKLENFPNFCKSEELYYGYVKTIIKNDEINDYNGFEGNSYYLEIAQLFQNTIANTEDAYTAWFDELNKKYAETKAATDKTNKDAEDKKNTENKIRGGGGQNVQWLKKHPALINKPETITVEGGAKATLYSLETDDPVVNQYKFGVLLVDAPGTSAHQTFQDVRVKTGTDIATPIDPDTDKFWQFAISQNDAWRYDDVAWSGAFGDKSQYNKLALTTNPDLEDDGSINQSIQTERTKSFRHNLLTEADLTIGSKGAEVESIQKKLGVLPVTKVFDENTKAAVIEFQTMMNILPVTGIVDNKTLKKINDYSVTVTPPPSATVYTRLLTIGSTGPDVEAVQTKLNRKKGKYGTDTQTAVMNYQKKYTDLDDTGDVDQKTFNHIMANTKLGVDIPISYSGKKHNYKKGEWIAVKPNSGNQASQLYENNGYFKILDVPDDYTIIINADWPKSVKGYAIAGGTTAKIIFGPNAEGGVKTIPTVSDNSTKGSRNKVYNSGTRSKGSTSTGNDVETKRREIRNSEYCDSLRKIKKHLNLKVDCKKYQSTLNKIMLALTGGVEIKPVATVTPVDQPQYNVVQPESPTNQFL